MSLSRNRNLLAVFSIVGALLGVVGCNETPTADPSTESAAEAAQPVATQGTLVRETNKDATPDAAKDDGPGCEHGKRGPKGHHGGPAFLLRAALGELELTAEQKTAIEGALAKLPAPPSHEKMAEGPGKAARAALAQGIRAGKIDTAALAPKDGERPDFAAMQASVAEAMQTLHKTLTKEQRRQLVDAVQKRAEEHMPKEMGEHGPRGEHGRGKHGFGRGGHGPMGFLLRDLDLTEQQQEAIKKAMEAQRPEGERPDAEAMKKHFEEMRAGMKARLESFASDNFDAKAFATPPAPPAGAPAMRHPGEHMNKLLSTVVPLLTDAQREKLAQRIESGPPARFGHHGRRGQEAQAEE